MHVNISLKLIKERVIYLNIGKADVPKITLGAARKNAGLTQKEAANKLHIAVSTLRNWEQGITFPDQPAIDAICNLYNLKYDYINFYNCN